MVPRQATEGTTRQFSPLIMEPWEGDLGLGPHSLDRTADQLSEVTGDDPKGQVLPSRSGGGERHDHPGLRHVPAPGTGALDETAEDHVLGRVFVSPSKPLAHGEDGVWRAAEFHSWPNMTHPLISELAVAVERRSADWEGHRAQHQRPLRPYPVHDGTAE